jgi:nicotinamide-nucleotide adenylyltransferase
MSVFSCLFVGRFQPFHNGHLLVIKGMTKVCGKIVVAIGSPEASHKSDNPFTAAERREMIQRALQAEDIIPNFDVSIVEVPDVGDDEAWGAKCLELAEHPHQVWTGNEWTKACFERLGIEVKSIKEVPGVSATEIRRRMEEGGDWKALVPKDVASYLVEINAVERLKKL